MGSTSQGRSCTVVWRGKRMRYYVRFRDDGGIMRWVSASRRYDARPARVPEEAKLVAARITTNGAPAQHSTLAALWGLYDGYLGLNGSPASRAARASSWRRLSSVLDPRRQVNDVSMGDAATYQRHEEARGVQVSWRNDLAMLKSMMSMGVVWIRQTGLSESPLAHLRIARPDPAGRDMTEDEARRLCDVAEIWAADAARRLTWAYVRLMLLLGTRPGELRQLPWSSVSPWGITTRVFKRRSKAARKVVGMNAEIQRALEDVRAVGGSRRPEAVFGYWSSDGAARVALQALWDELRTLSSLEDVRLHDARSTVGTAVTRALGLRAAQGALAHGTHATTERYYAHDDPSARVDLSLMQRYVEKSFPQGVPNRSSGDTLV